MDAPVRPYICPDAFPSVFSYHTHTLFRLANSVSPGEAHPALSLQPCVGRSRWGLYLELTRDLGTSRLPLLQSHKRAALKRCGGKRCMLCGAAGPAERASHLLGGICCMTHRCHFLPSSTGRTR
ncbi:unnamed protein product [Arctogadus glacialis]